jgi:arylsulfatase A-like enzyme
MNFPTSTRSPARNPQGQAWCALRPPIRRVVVTVLDGLRPDAIDHFGLSNIAALAASGASTMSAQTVDPSITVAAMASLLTGVPPAYHGVRSEHFHIPRRRGAVDPMPRVLAEAGIPSSAFLLQLPVIHRVVARRVVGAVGVTDVHFAGRCASDILDAARATLQSASHGLVILHWPDADDAGHEDGWMSPAYGVGARALDAAVGDLVSELALADDPDTVLILTADHGGGGAVPCAHESDHPLDRTIPVIVVGTTSLAGTLGTDVSILDLPATVLWLLGARIPESYAGRPLCEAFAGAQAAAAA